MDSASCFELLRTWKAGQKSSIIKDVFKTLKGVGGGGMSASSAAARSILMQRRLASWRPRRPRPTSEFRFKVEKASDVFCG